MKYCHLLFFFGLFILLACDKNHNIKQAKSNDFSYDVIFRESLAGSYKKYSIGDNSYRFLYEYTDRGRGPNFSEEITLNEDSYIKKQFIIGVNYLKDSIYESFESSGNSATWINPSGEKKGSFNGKQLYYRFDGSPAIFEILTHLILNSSSHKVRLYPEGEVELVQDLSFNIDNKIPAKLIILKGLDINPTYVWMDENDQMIAKIAGNLHVVREDFKSLRRELKEIQDSVENDYLYETAKKLSHKISSAIIKNVNVFTPDGTLLMNQDVFVKGNTIQAITSTSQKHIPNPDIIIDGSNKTLMPGLFDSHTHNDKFRGVLHIAGGVTSVRDLANNKQLKDLSKKFDYNEIIGPRIVTLCGIIDGPGPFANQRNVINNLEEGLREIKIYKDLGYQQIKLYSSIKPEWVKPLAESSHELGMKVSGHIPAFMTAAQAINNGYNEIQHINMLFLNFLSDTIDTRTPLRFTMVAKHGANLDLKSKEYLDFVELLKSKNILVDPTVSIFENMFISEKGEPSPTFKKVIQRLPLITQRDFYSGGLPKPKGQEKLYFESFNKMLEVINDLYQNGVKIVPGTDGFPGFLFHRELELYNRAGIPASELLKLATIESAELTGVSNSLGSIEVGKKADLILIDGNPLDDISDIRKIEWTMKGGNLYYSKELYASLGIKYFK